VSFVRFWLVFCIAFFATNSFTALYENYIEEWHSLPVDDPLVQMHLPHGMIINSHAYAELYMIAPLCDGQVVPDQAQVTLHIQNAGSCVGLAFPQEALQTIQSQPAVQQPQLLVTEW
jgi:hypothetical protein